MLNFWLAVETGGADGSRLLRLMMKVTGTGFMWLFCSLSGAYKTAPVELEGMNHSWRQWEPGTPRE